MVGDIFVSDDEDIDGMPVCKRCKRRPIEGYRSFYYCIECLENYRKDMQKRREERRKKGQCLWCGKPVDFRYSNCLCNKCLKRHNYLEKYRRGYYPDLGNELEEVRIYIEQQNSRK